MYDLRTTQIELVDHRARVLRAEATRYGLRVAAQWLRGLFAGARRPHHT